MSQLKAIAQLNYKPPAGLTSRHSIGDDVLFRVYQNPVGGDPGKIVGVSFTESKVLYDIALYVNGAPYYEHPIRCVDSVFVNPAPQE